MENNAPNHAETICTKLQELVVHMPTAGYIRQAGLIPHILPFSPATLWRLVKEGRFPAPYKISQRVTAWRVGEVQAWAAKAPQIRVHKRTVKPISS